MSQFFPLINLNPNSQNKEKGYFQFLQQYEDVSDDEEWDSTDFYKLDMKTKKRDNEIDQ